MQSQGEQEEFIKRPREPRSAEAEAAGLRWLGEASTCVAEVLWVEGNTLATRRVPHVRPSVAAAYRAGEELAKIHAAGAPAFGSPPTGWEGPNYIGTQQQECVPEEDWARFYTRQRVLPFAYAGAEVGNLSAQGLKQVQRACEAMCQAQHDHWDVEPARIHGDLWAGNLMFGPQGPVMIDPAAHGGHPVTDLAMLALFGAPYIEDIYRGYQSRVKLESDWQRWISMHQLHPLAVHALTHGPAYADELVRAAKETLVQL